MALITLDYLNEISGGDKDFQREIINTFLEQIGDDMKLLQQFSAEGNWVEMGKMAHKIKAPIKMFCTEPVQSVVVFLEQNGKSMMQTQILPTKVQELAKLVDAAVAELRSITL